MPSERGLIQQIQSHVTRQVQAVAYAEFWHDRWLEQTEQEHQRHPFLSSSVGTRCSFS